MKDYSSTKKYLEKALDKATEIKDTGLVFRALLNLGRTEVEQKQLKQGLEYYQKAYSFCEGKNRMIDRSLLLTNHGVVLFELGRLEESEKLLNEALEINQKLSIQKGKLNIYLNLGSIAFEKKDIQKATELLKTAEGFLSDNFNISSAIKIKLLLAKCHTLSKNPELGVEYFESYVALKDSASKEEQARFIKELETKHHVKEVEQEKSLAETKVIQEKEKNFFYRFLLFSILAMLCLFIALFYLYNKKKRAEREAIAQKQKTEAVINAEEKERSRIAKDLHDGVAQDLAILKHKICSVEKKFVDPSVKTEFESILKELDKTAKEIREISYQMMPVTLQQYGLSVALEDLLNRALTPKNISFDFNNTGVIEKLPEKIETSVYRICQELLNNTVKHSFASHVSLLISVEGGFIRINYEDNGKGFDLNRVSKGIGLNSLTSRIEMIRGSLEIDSRINLGTTAYIKIPF
ncbi:MAG: sensor histidine kinase [Bacteroidia bacterium]|nr:sensor histidine kinase [Bacteroidia bacterium]